MYCTYLRNGGRLRIWPQRFVDKWNLGSLGKFVIDQRLLQEYPEANLARKFTAVKL